MYIHSHTFISGPGDYVSGRNSTMYLSPTQRTQLILHQVLQSPKIPPQLALIFMKSIFLFYKAIYFWVMGTWYDQWIPWVLMYWSIVLILFCNNIINYYYYLNCLIRNNNVQTVIMMYKSILRPHITRWKGKKILIQKNFLFQRGQIIAPS